MEEFCKLLDWLKDNPDTTVTARYLAKMGAFDVQVRRGDRYTPSSVILYEDALDKIVGIALGGCVDAVREMQM